VLIFEDRRFVESGQSTRVPQTGSAALYLSSREACLWHGIVERLVAMVVGGGVVVVVTKKSTGEELRTLGSWAGARNG